MNWGQELQDSALWILQAFVISSVMLGLVGFILVKTTKWAGQFWLLAGDYFNPKNSLRPLLTFGVILFLSLFGVRVSVLLKLVQHDVYRVARTE